MEAGWVVYIRMWCGGGGGCSHIVSFFFFFFDFWIFSSMESGKFDWTSKSFLTGLLGLRLFDELEPNWQTLCKKKKKNIEIYIIIHHLTLVMVRLSTLPYITHPPTLIFYKCMYLLLCLSVFLKAYLADAISIYSKSFSLFFSRHQSVNTHHSLTHNISTVPTIT